MKHNHTQVSALHEVARFLDNHDLPELLSFTLYDGVASVLVFPEDFTTWTDVLTVANKTLERTESDKAGTHHLTAHTMLGSVPLDVKTIIRSGQMAIVEFAALVGADTTAVAEPVLV